VTAELLTLFLRGTVSGMGSISETYFKRVRNAYKSWEL